MECKECGAKFKKEAQFCGVCGTKVEKLPNTCEKCGGIVSEKAKFCRHCGEAVEGEIAVTFEPVIAKKGLSEKSKQIMKKGSIGVAAIVVLIVAITLFKNSPTISGSYDLDLMFFKTYDNEIFGKSARSKEYILKETNFSKIMVSKDGKKIYFIDDDEDLYLKDGKKEPERIARDVEWFAISPMGNTVAFIKDQHGYYDLGTLYVKSGKADPVRVSSENCASFTVSISDNGRYVAFTEADGDYFDEDDLRNYLYPVGKEKIKGTRQISIGVDNKGTMLAVNEDQDLYMIKQGKDSNKIASEIEVVIANQDFSRLLILDELGNLYAYNGKEKEKVESNIEGIGNIKGLSAKKDSFFWQTQTKDLDIVFYKNGNTYIKLDGKDSERIVHRYTHDLQISEDFRNIAYINDNGLYVKRFKNNKLKVDEKIESHVSEIHMDPTGSHIAYKKSNDLYYLEKGKKVGLQVDTKDSIRDFAIGKDGSIYYRTRESDLFLTRDRKTGKKIATDIYHWDMTSKAAYIIDYDQTLFEIVGSGKPTKIADDVTELVKPVSNNYILSYY